MQLCPPSSCIRGRLLWPALRIRALLRICLALESSKQLGLVGVGEATLGSSAAELPFREWILAFPELLTPLHG